VKGLKLKEISPRGICEKVRWKGRDAVRLANGMVEMISLTCGGHLSVFRFLNHNGRPSQNVLWEAPWTTCDPERVWSDERSQLYGSPETGRFLAGFTGHALCLDYFGEPTAEKAAAGLSIHGEAAIARWKVIGSSLTEKVQCKWRVALPISQLSFEREVQLSNGQSVAYIEETVTNKREIAHQFDCVQHVTFGPPFLSEGMSTVTASACSGVTSPLGYEGKSLLPNNHHFSWPYAQRAANKGPADLRLPFTEKGQGFLAGMKLDPGKSVEYISVINWESRLGVAYCFRRCDFPWIAVWEENCARQVPPWNGSTQARGMEFGTRPLPLAGYGGFPGETFSDTPRGCSIAPMARKLRATSCLYLKCHRICIPSEALNQLTMRSRFTTKTEQLPFPSRPTDVKRFLLSDRTAVRCPGEAFCGDLCLRAFCRSIAMMQPTPVSRFSPVLL
jgi:hypothetical protein